jgi:hypothetical protein
MNKAWMAIALVGALGCKAKDKGVDVGSGAVPAEQKLDKLVVELDGKPVAMSSAVIKQLPDGKTQLYVSPRKVVTCTELLANVFNEKRPDTVLVDLPVRLGADGKEAGTVGDLYLGGPPKPADAGGTSTVTGPVTKGATVAIDLAFTGTGGNGEKVSVKGSLTAEGCGDQPLEPGPGVPKQTHASTAKMTIAGKTFEIKGAIRKGTAIELLDWPRECLAAKFIGARVALATDGTWHLDGQRFASESVSKPSIATGPAAGGGSAVGSGSGSAGSGSAAAGAGSDAVANTFAAKPGKETAGAAGADSTVELALSGDGKIGDYTVKLEGTVEAIDCK